MPLAGFLRHSAAHRQAVVRLRERFPRMRRLLVSMDARAWRRAGCPVFWPKGSTFEDSQPGDEVVLDIPEGADFIPDPRFIVAHAWAATSSSNKAP